VIVIDPRGYEPVEWCDYTGDNLSAFVSTMKIEKNEQWQDWGAHALNVLRIHGVMIPHPYHFFKFDDWAMRFNQLIQNL